MLISMGESTRSPVPSRYFSERINDVMVYRKFGGGGDCFPVTGDDGGGEGRSERGVDFLYMDGGWRGVDENLS